MEEVLGQMCDRWVSGNLEDVIARTGGALFGARVLWVTVLSPLLVYALLLPYNLLRDRLRPKPTEEQLAQTRLTDKLCAELDVMSSLTLGPSETIAKLTAGNIKVDVVIIPQTKQPPAHVDPIKAATAKKRAITPLELGDMGWALFGQKVREVVLGHLRRHHLERLQAERESRGRARREIEEDLTRLATPS